MTSPAAIGSPSAGAGTSPTAAGLSSIAYAAGPNSAPARLTGSYVRAASFLSSIVTGVLAGGAAVPVAVLPVAVLPVPVLPVPDVADAGLFAVLAGGGVTGGFVAAG